MTTDATTNYGPILEVHGLAKTYRSARGPLTVLSGIDFSLGAGESLAIVGPSGSGKTTLLGLCAGLDAPSEGTVVAAGVNLGSLGEDGRAAFRRKEVGFVFQTFQLLPTLTAVENVMVPLELRGERGAKAKAAELLARVGLGERLEHYPVQLSGGEQQRVALARAFIHQPRLLFADEPTGNLDSVTGARLIELLFELNQAHRTTLVLVTHDLDLAARTRRQLRVRSGRLEA
jgi:putative ABC transport system ATP-binding protein